MRRRSQSRSVAAANAVKRDDVTAHIRALRERGLAPSSIERKVAAIKSFHRFCVREGIAEDQPTAQSAASRKSPSGFRT